MRNISAALQSHINSGATTLCHIWTLTRNDGTVFGFTDHDQDLHVRGVDYLALSGNQGGGMSGGDMDSSLGFSIDNSHVQSVLSDARITADDINAGAYDGALLETHIVNWMSLAQVLALSRGYLGAITQNGAAFTAEWTGEGARLDRSQGRVFSRLCDASFGDTRCGLSADDFAQGTVCPRSYSACRDIFGNVENFRGFPYLLGDDAIVAAPVESDIRDGGSRYRGAVI